MSLFSGLGSLFSGGSASNALGASTDNPLRRFLQERSFLLFEFNKIGSTPQLSLLPFFENISIVEDQRANYAVYDLIGRAGNVYSYTGAKSRQFKINFKMNVLHINEILKKEGSEFFDPSYFSSESTSKEDIRDLFINPKSIDKNKLKKDTTVDWSEKAVSDYEALIERDPSLLKSASTGLTDVEEFARNSFSIAQPFTNIPLQNFNLPSTRRRFRFKYNSFQKSINLVMFWVNLVRTSVINNTENQTQGPPIIRLNHGLMYNNIPCICTNFSIKEANNTSYDVPNMMPYVIEISMSLEEVRQSAESFKPADYIRGDSVPGWNNFLQYKTMDPYNGIWGDV